MFKHLNNYKILVIIHNLSYDIRFLIDRVICHGILQKGSKTLSCKCCRVHYGEQVKFTLKDTACLIPMKLADFGSCFNLETEKDVMPYTLFTNVNFQNVYVQVKTPLQFLNKITKNVKSAGPPGATRL